MATAKLLVTVLDVGQGQGTFVEVYNTLGQLTNTLLFDLGSLKAKKTAGGTSIGYITKILDSSQTPTTMSVPTIDYLSLSHADGDHVNLIMTMIKSVEDKTGKTMKFGKIRFGGIKDWYAAIFFVELGKRCTDIIPLNLNHQAYNTLTTNYEAIWDANEVYAYVILANVPDKAATTVFKKDKPDVELANCVSIISTVYFKDQKGAAYQFFVNGDATFTTFEGFNNIYSFLPKFENVQMVTLPHHGSRRTTFGLSSGSADASSASKKVVQTFSNKIGGKTATASAEVFGNYHHPSLDVISAFLSPTDTKPWYSDPDLDFGRHYLTAFLDIPLKDAKGNQKDGVYSSFETEINVYTTLYCSGGIIGNFLSPPNNPVGPATSWGKKKRPVFPEGLRWIYTVLAAGGITLTRNTNRQGLLFTKKEVQNIPANIPAYSAVRTKSRALKNLQHRLT